VIIAQKVNTSKDNSQGSAGALLGTSLKPSKAAAAGGVTAPPAAAPGGVTASPASLGTNAKYVRGLSGVVVEGDKWSGLYQLQQWGAVKLLREYQDRELWASGITPGGIDSRLGYHRVCFCHWAKWADEVSVVYSEQHKRSNYKGVQTCGSWAVCPVCSSKIAEVRCVELAGAVAEIRARGLLPCLGGLTLPHKADDDLGELWDRLNKRYRAIKNTKTWARLEREYGVEMAPGKFRLVPVTGFENTWGYNGHHPHKHPLFALRAGADVESFRGELRDLWYSSLGGEYLPDPDTGELLPANPDQWRHGADVTCNEGAIGEYIAKFGRPPRWDLPEELSKWHRKRGRGRRLSPHYSMMQLLVSYVQTGDSEHGRAWLEFAVAAKGRHQLDWAPGWREWLGLGAEKSDEDIIAEESDKVRDLAVLDDDTWRLVCRAEERGELRAVADSGCGELVEVWISDLWASWLAKRPPGGVVVARGPS
jgi:hypothetical protein